MYQRLLFATALRVTQLIKIQNKTFRVFKKSILVSSVEFSFRKIDEDLWNSNVREAADDFHQGKINEAKIKSHGFTWLHCCYVIFSTTPLA